LNRIDQGPAAQEPLDLVWGADRIATMLGRTRRQAFHLLEGGHIPGAKKIGGRWVVPLIKLRELFGL